MQVTSQRSIAAGKKVNNNNIKRVKNLQVNSGAQIKTADKVINHNSGKSKGNK